MSTLKNRVANALKQYNNSGAAILALIPELVDHAKANNHNFQLVNQLYAGMKGRRDAKAIEIIVKDLCNATLKDGGFKMGKERVYHDRDCSAFKSFRSLADALNDAAADDKEPAAFDLQKYAKNVSKKLSDNGVTIDQLEAAIEALKAEQK